MERVPENFPRPWNEWNAYDDMVKWEKETAYTGDNLYFDWVTSWLNPVPNVAAAQAPSDVAAANQVPVQRARQRLTNRRLPRQTLPETAAADQQASKTAAVVLAIPEDAAAAELPAHTDSEAVHTASALPSGPTLVERFDIEPFFDFSAK